jgi:hypothetical protein
MQYTKYTSAQPKRVLFFGGVGGIYSSCDKLFIDISSQKKRGKKKLEAKMQQWLRISSLVTH